MISIPHYFFILCLIGTSLFGGVKDHLKPVEGKESAYSMPNIDFIYMINLDHRQEKFDLSMEQLETIGIYPYRFSAIYWEDLSFEVINDLGVIYESGMRRDIKATTYFIDEHGELTWRHGYTQTPGITYYSHYLSRGPIAIILSHLSVLQDAYDSGYETIWVMEDDIQVMSDPWELSTLIDKLDRVDPVWDILFTDIDTRNNNGHLVPCRVITERPNFPAPKIETTVINSDFTRITARYGAYSMIIRRSGVKKLLDFFKTYKLFLPYDMDMFFAPDLHIYRTNKEIVATRLNALSDNR